MKATRSKPVLLAVGLVCASAALAHAQQPTAPDSAAIARTIEELSRKYSDAIEAENVAVLDSLLADDAWLVRPNGDRQSKADFLASIKPGGSNATFHDVRNVIVHVHGNDVAVAVAQQSLAGTSHTGGKLASRNTSGSIWVNRGGSWRIVLRGVTPVTKGGAQ